MLKKKKEKVKSIGITVHRLFCPQVQSLFPLKKVAQVLPKTRPCFVFMHSKRAEMSDHYSVVVVAWVLHCSDSRQVEEKVKRGEF